jgi:hypothetical protein
MTDYARANTGGATHFGDKDALTSGDADKKIVGAQFDSEYNAILTAVNSKFDPTDVASEAQAQAESSASVILTPLSLAQWSDDNAGAVGDLQAWADPNADALFGWDDSAGAAIGFTLGAGLGFSTTTIDVAAGLAGTGLTMTSSVLNVIGGNGITANANDIALTDSAVSSTNPIGFTSGAPVFDASSLTAIEGTDLAGTDIVIVEQSGTPKRIPIQDMGLRVIAGGTPTDQLAVTDMNAILQYTGTSTLTIPLKTTTDLPIGVPVVLQVKHATEKLTVTAAASVTLVSKWHPGGETESDLVKAGGTAILYQTADNVWCLSGDILDA